MDEWLGIKIKNKKQMTIKKKIILVSVVVIILIVSGLSYLYLTSTDEDKFKDISKFRDHLLNKTDNNDEKLYEVTSLTSSASYLNTVDDPEHTLFCAIGVERRYSSFEVEAIIDFVKAGGSVIIADDYGYGNSISDVELDHGESFNVRFTGKPLWDENYAKNPRFIKILVNRHESRLSFDGVILLNDPSAIQPSSRYDKWYGRTMVASSSRGWIDMNGDGKLSPNVEGEYMERKPIVHEVGLGKGKTIFISDPSIFIDDMWDRENNSAFIDAMVRYLIPNTDEDNIKNNRTKEIVILPGLGKSKHKKFEDAEPVDIIPGYDSDGDGLLNFEEDANNNGIQDKSLGETDPNDPDSDDDGLLDGEEYSWWINRYFVQKEYGQIPNWVMDIHPDLNNDPLFDLYKPSGDLDGDGLANILDMDSDNDGWSDGNEVNEKYTDAANPDSDGEAI